MMPRAFFIFAILAVLSGSPFSPSPFLAFPARADPSPGVQWLMNEPLTLFERGLQRLGARMNRLIAQSQGSEAFPKNTRLIRGAAFYRFEKNTLVLSAWAQAVVDLAHNANTCRLVVRWLRRELLRSDGAARFLDNQFRHDQFERRSRPGNLGAELARITEIRVSLFRPGPLQGLGFDCRGGLSGGPISISRHDLVPVR